MYIFSSINTLVHAQKSNHVPMYSTTRGSSCLTMQRMGMNNVNHDNQRTPISLDLSKKGKKQYIRKTAQNRSPRGRMSSILSN